MTAIADPRMASSPTEVEIKFRIVNIQAIQRRLRAAGFRLKTKRTHEMNVLYDSADGSIRERGEVLRIRKYGKSWKLTHKSKGAAGKHKSRVEVETEVSDGEKLAQILLSLGYRVSFQYEKFRTEWTDGAGDVVIDETPIGTFGEIEGRPKWIDGTAKKLDVAESDYINKSYAELFHDWKVANRYNSEQMMFESVPNYTSTKR